MRARSTAIDSAGDLERAGAVESAREARATSRARDEAKDASSRASNDVDALRALARAASAARGAEAAMTRERCVDALRAASSREADDEADARGAVDEYLEDEGWGDDGDEDDEYN